MTQVRRIVAVVGATATGKTSHGIRLAQALGGEVIGADSRQVYRHMDIGTAKPTAEELGAVAHHLIDVADPDGPFSLGTWLDLARSAAQEIWSRGRLPLLVGGTGQYVWALLEGWRVPRVPPQPNLRATFESRAPADLVAQLRNVDPEAGDYIDPRNVRRVIRALEVYEATGKPFSYWRTKEAPEFESLVIGLALPREEIYQRIDERIDGMFASGLIEEVRSLLERGYGRDLASMSGIGYREVSEYLAGERTLESATVGTKTGTHRLARHQNSWFKASDERIHWVGPGADPAGMVAAWLDR